MRNQVCHSFGAALSVPVLRRLSVIAILATIYAMSRLVVADEKTSLPPPFAGLKEITNIQMTCSTVNGEWIYDMPAADWESLKLACRKAEIEPHALKWEGFGYVLAVADGSPRKWFLMFITKDEGAIKRMDTGQYWRHIDAKVIRKLLAECEANGKKRF